MDFTKVEIADNFWSPRVKTNSEVTIPHALKKCESEGRIDNFKFAAGLEDGRWRGSWGFVAIERGPIVYCFEEADNGKILEPHPDGSSLGANAAEILISKTKAFKPSFDPELFGGVVTLSDGQMTVWLNR